MEKEFTLVEHLRELRARIIVCLVAFGISILVIWPFTSAILWMLKLPAAGLIEKLAFFSPQEAFTIYMQVAMFCAGIISMPVIIYEFWQFIAPAMEARLRRKVSFFIIFCFLAFVMGGAFAYFVLIPPALKFLLSFANGQLMPIISAQKYFSFLTTLILGCGLIFQMPILTLILTKLKIITARFLRNKYKYAIVIILILAAVITPTTDIMNMILLAAPMILLYEISIWVAFFAGPKKGMSNLTHSLPNVG